MASMKFKLSKSGRENRVLKFPDPPSWGPLATRISSLFDIPPNKVAVSYEDHDGDMVTMSSQEELVDYLTNWHRENEVKFTVVDLRELRAARGEAAGNAEHLRDGSAPGGFPNLEEELFFDIQNGWQNLSGPRMYGGNGNIDTPEEEPHAFVEVIESDISGSKRTSQHSRSNAPSRAQSQLYNKGKGKAPEVATVQSKATSEVSVVDEDAPLKPAVHVFDVSDATGLSPRTDTILINSPTLGRDGYSSGAGIPRGSAFGDRANDFLAPMDTSSPRADSDQSKPLPRTPTSQPGSFHPMSTTLSTQSTPKQPHISGLPPPPSESTAGPRSTRPVPESGPSFVNDIASLLDGLTAAVAAHPELSEGLRNIVKNTVQGTYFNAERERIVSAADDVRFAAERASEHIAKAAGNLANDSEQEAGRRIAQALSGIFKVIGDLSNGISNLSAPTAQGTSAPPATAQATGQGLPPRPPPGVMPSFPPPPPPIRGHSMPGAWPGYGPPPFPPIGGYYGARPVSLQPHFSQAPPPSVSLGTRPSPSEGPQTPGDSGHPSHRPWDLARTGSYPLQRGDSYSRYDSYIPPYLVGYPYDYQVEPFHHRFDAHESKASLEAAKALYKSEKERFRQDKEERRKIRQELAQKRAEEGKKPRENERDETIVARIALPSPSKGPRRAFAEVVSVPGQQSRQIGPGSSNPAAVQGPIPPPPKPIIRPSPVSTHGGGLSLLSDRVMARLSDMGITPYTHPDMVNTLNEIISPNGESTKDTEEEIIAKMVHRLNIRGSPSPRPSGSRLPF